MPVDHAITIGTPKTGTKYIVELLKANGYNGAVHEDAYLDYQACQYRQGNLPPELHGPLTAPTREDDVWFEANNTLTWFLPHLQDRHEDLRIIYLHRGGHDVVRSLMSGQGLTPQTGWEKTPNLVPPAKDWDAPHFIKACHAWSDANSWTLEHLTLDDNTLILPSQALWNQDQAAQALANFLHIDLPQTDIPPVDKRDTHSFPTFNRWPRPYKVTFWAYCQPAMQALGYTQNETPLTHTPQPQPNPAPDPRIEDGPDPTIPVDPDNPPPGSGGNVDRSETGTHDMDEADGADLVINEGDEP